EGEPVSARKSVDERRDARGLSATAVRILAGSGGPGIVAGRRAHAERAALLQALDRAGRALSQAPSARAAYHANKRHADHRGMGVVFQAAWLPGRTEHRRTARVA